MEHTIFVMFFENFYEIFVGGDLGPSQFYPFFALFTVARNLVFHMFAEILMFPPQMIVQNFDILFNK